MKSYDKAFYEQLDYIMQQYREGHIKTVPELVKFINMIYGDYRDYHPEEWPEIRYEPGNEPNSIREESSGEQQSSDPVSGEDVR